MLPCKKNESIGNILLNDTLEVTNCVEDIIPVLRVPFMQVGKCWKIGHSPQPQMISNNFLTRKTENDKTWRKLIASIVTNETMHRQYGGSPDVWAVMSSYRVGAFCVAGTQQMFVQRMGNWEQNFLKQLD